MADLVAPIIPNIRADPTIFLTAFQQALENKRKQADLERKMESMLINERQRDQQIQLGQERMQLGAQVADWRHEKDMNTMSLTAKHFNDMAESSDARLKLSGERLDLEKAKSDTANEKYGKDTGALLDFQKALGAIEAEPGTQEWEHQANLVRSKYGSVTWSTSGERIWKDAFQAHKSSASEMNKAAGNLAKDYYQSLRAKRIHEDWLSDDQDWGTNKDGSRFIAYDTHTWGRLPNNTAPKEGVDFRTISGREYDTIRQQQSRVAELHGSDTNRPARQAAKETAPPNPADRIKDEVYQTPRGILKWTGSGWVMP